MLRVSPQLIDYQCRLQSRSVLALRYHLPVPARLSRSNPAMYGFIFWRSNFERRRSAARPWKAPCPCSATSNDFNVGKYLPSDAVLTHVETLTTPTPVIFQIILNRMTANWLRVSSSIDFKKSGRIMNTVVGQI